MKRTLSLWLGLAAAAGLLALALAPAVAQQPAPAAASHRQDSRPRHQSHRATAGRRHGEPLHRWRRRPLKYTFPVSDTGEYSGEAPPGTYTVVYRAADTPAGKMVDSIRGIKIVVGQDLAQDDDMSRQEFIDKMTPEEKKQLEELKKQNAEAMKANTVINQLNADLKMVSQDKKDIDGATATATQALGATASKADIAAKVAEIKTAKYTDIESLMTKDTAAQARRGSAVGQPWATRRPG